MEHRTRPRLQQVANEILSFDEIAGADNVAILRRQHHYRMLWTYAVNAILAVWLITSPHLFHYGSGALERSDTVSGGIVLLSEAISFAPRLFLLRWATPLTGLWLLFAPLVFWAPNPASYITDTLIGAVLIAMSVTIPGAPGTGGIAEAGCDKPRGWTYNPSSWIRRWLGIALALLGFFISRYLAARQLGYMAHAWDPFFGTTDKVLHSSVSRAFPISDAGFGSVAYLLEVLFGLTGDRARWRTAPWAVASFAALVLPLGLTSIVLVILQPTVVGAWCGLCLVAAAGLLTSVPLAVHEIIASGLFFADARRQGKNLWKLFWFGGTYANSQPDDPDRTNFSLMQRWNASVQGITVPFTLFVQLALGAWLMARPGVISGSILSADIDQFIGALVVTFAAVATAEVTRALRLPNILFGLVLIAAAILFARHQPAILLDEVVCGTLLIVTSLPKGAILERYNGWDRFIR